MMTHKDFIPPPDPLYVPLHVGRAVCSFSGEGEKERGLSEKERIVMRRNYPILRFIGDDTGDSISIRNDNFSELTGLYWVWKNDHDSDIVGTAHYRRYLIRDVGGEKAEQKSGISKKEEETFGVDRWQGAAGG